VRVRDGENARLERALDIAVRGDSRVEDEDGSRDGRRRRFEHCEYRVAPILGRGWVARVMCRKDRADVGLHGAHAKPNVRYRIELAQSLGRVAREFPLPDFDMRRPERRIARDVLRK